MLWKRITVLFLSLSVVCGFAWSTGQKEVAGIQAPGRLDTSQRALQEPLGGLTLPLSERPIELSMFIGEHPNYPIRDDFPVLEEMFRRTNIRIRFITAPEANRNEKKNVLLASGDMPDFIPYLTAADIQENSSLFLELQTLIRDHAPNINQRFTPEIRAFREIIPGKIHTIPWNEYQIAQLGFDYRADYLEKLGYTSEPTTIAEWTEVLRQAKATDLNGNGMLDTVPIVNRRGTANMLRLVAGSFGLNPDDNNVLWWIENGRMTFGAKTDRQKSMIEWKRQLYSEGLLDVEYATLDTKGWEAKMTNGTGFATWDWFTRVSMFNDIMVSEDPIYRLAGARQPVGPFGDAAVFRGLEMPRGGMGVSAKTRHPVEAMKWMDYQFSRQGKILSFMGLENVSFVYGAAGKPVFVDEYRNMINDYKLGVKFLPLMDAFPEGHEQRLQNNPSTWDAIEKNIDINQVSFPGLAFTAAETARLTELMPDMMRLIEQYTDEFIMDRRAMSDWDAMLSTLGRMGMDEVEKIYNDAYRRYLGR